MSQDNSFSFDELQEKTINENEFRPEGRFAHCGVQVTFKDILKLEIAFEDAFATVDALNASLPQGQGYYVKPQTIVEIDTSGRMIQSTRRFALLVRPPPGSIGRLEPRVYRPGHCARIKVSKIGSVKRSPAVEYALYLLEVAREMLDDAESAMSQNRFGLAMHFSRYSIEFSAKSIIASAGKQWPKNEHDVSEFLRRTEVSRTFKSSMSIEQIAWDLSLWANPPRTDLYGNPYSFTEPFAIIPIEEVRMVKERADKIHVAALENYEMNHLVRI